MYKLELTKENPIIPRKFLSHIHKHDDVDEKLKKKAIGNSKSKNRNSASSPKI